MDITLIMDLDIDDRFKAYLYEECRYMTDEEFNEFFDGCTIDGDTITTPEKRYGVMVLSEMDAIAEMNYIVEEHLENIKTITRHQYDWLLDAINAEQLADKFPINEFYPDCIETEWENQTFYYYDA